MYSLIAYMRSLVHDITPQTCQHDFANYSIVEQYAWEHI